jgi:hypothetical protein
VAELNIFVAWTRFIGWVERAWRLILRKGMGPASRQALYNSNLPLVAKKKSPKIRSSAITSKPFYFIGFYFISIT